VYDFIFTFNMRHFDTNLLDSRNIKGDTWLYEEKRCNLANKSVKSAKSMARLNTYVFLDNLDGINRENTELMEAKRMPDGWFDI